MIREEGEEAAAFPPPIAPPKLPPAPPPPFASAAELEQLSLPAAVVIGRLLAAEGERVREDG